MEKHGKERNPLEKLAEEVKLAICAGGAGKEREYRNLEHERMTILGKILSKKLAAHDLHRRSLAHSLSGVSEFLYERCGHEEKVEIG